MYKPNEKLVVSLFISIQITRHLLLQNLWDKVSELVSGDIKNSIKESLEMRNPNVLYMIMLKLPAPLPKAIYDFESYEK